MSAQTMRRHNKRRFRFTFNYQDASAVAETRLRRALDNVLENIRKYVTLEVGNIENYFKNTYKYTRIHQTYTK